MEKRLVKIGEAAALLGVSVDTLRCDCGMTIDRDLNAAINIATYAASSAVAACRESGSGVALAA